MRFGLLGVRDGVHGLTLQLTQSRVHQDIVEGIVDLDQALARSVDHQLLLVQLLLGLQLHQLLVVEQTVALLQLLLVDQLLLHGQLLLATLLLLTDQLLRAGQLLQLLQRLHVTGGSAVRTVAAHLHRRVGHGLRLQLAHGDGG